MKGHEVIARRYAKALFLVAREAGEPEAVGRDLAGFLEVMAADRRLDELLRRPWIRGAAKRAVAGAIAERLGCGALARDFLGLLAERGRLDHLAVVLRAYRGLEDEARGRVRARVRSRVALGEADRERLVARLSRIAGKQVMVEASVDPRLLGGFVAQIGSLVVDGSLDGQLARMREHLVGDRG